MRHKTKTRALVLFLTLLLGPLPALVGFLGSAVQIVSAQDTAPRGAGR